MKGQPGEEPPGLIVCILGAISLYFLFTGKERAGEQKSSSESSVFRGLWAFLHAGGFGWPCHGLQQEVMLPHGQRAEGSLAKTRETQPGS